MQKEEIDEKDAHCCRLGCSFCDSGIFPTMGGSKIDYLDMLIVDDVLYVDMFTPVTDVQEEDILGCKKSYTKTEPRRNGQANFEKGTLYAATGDGIAIQIADQWILFKKYE